MWVSTTKFSENCMILVEYSWHEAQLVEHLCTGM